MWELISLQLETVGEHLAVITDEMARMTWESMEAIASHKRKLHPVSDPLKMQGMHTPETERRHAQATASLNDHRDTAD